MKRILILILLSYSTFSYAQNLDCSKFKTGHFKYFEGDYADLLTVRTDTTQIDSYVKTSDLKATSRLKWLSDCQYEFEYYKVNDPRFESIIGTKYTVEITEINGDTIVCQKLVNGKLSQPQRMIKIKD